MEKLPLMITNGYRLLIGALLIYLMIQEDLTAGITIHSWIVICSVLTYTLVFSLFNNSKPFQFIDWILVLFALNYTGIIYFAALAIPSFINIVSKNRMVISSLFLFVTTFGTLIYFSISTLNAITVSLSVLISCILFSLNFVKISLLEERNKSLKEDIESLRIGNSVKSNQIETVSKLFIHKQNLDEIQNIDELQNQILYSAQDYFNSYYVSLYLYKNGRFEKVGSKGDNQKYNSPDYLEVKEGIKTFYDRNNLRVPMIYENDTWGCVSIYGKRSRLGENGKMIFFPFEEADFEILSIYLDSAMNRLKDLRKNEQLKKAALYDRLTNLPNRTFIEGDLFSSFVNRFKTEKQQFSVILLDIDHFKSFNDTFGHLVGDEVLTIVAHILEECSRKMGGHNSFGRWGGEEFVGFLSGTPEECYRKAEFIRRAVADYKFSYRAITISLGVASFEYHGRDLKRLVENADLALYQSKDRGRNKVTMFSKGGL